jgi:hypothetical protein
VNNQELVEVEETPVKNPAGVSMTLTTGKLRNPISTGPPDEPVALPPAVERALRPGRCLGKLSRPRSELGRKALGIPVPVRRSGHAPRPGTNARTRGSSRTSSSRASPGDDDPDESDPDPPGRTCASCGRSIEDQHPNARYCEDCAPSRARVRKHRRGGRVPEAKADPDRQLHDHGELVRERLPRWTLDPVAEFLSLDFLDRLALIEAAGIRDEVALRLLVTPQREATS